MKIATVVISGLCVLLLASVLTRGNVTTERAGLSGLCPQMQQQAVTLPEDKALYLAGLLNEADRLNNSGTCVIEGGYGKDSGRFYLAVRDHNGGKPYFKRYTAADLLNQKP